jgi:hypothetical protein
MKEQRMAASVAYICEATWRLAGVGPVQAL